MYPFSDFKPLYDIQTLAAKKTLQFFLTFTGRPLNQHNQNCLEIHLDGPFGAPASNIFRAEHAVLVSIQFWDHSSKIRHLCLMKWHDQTLENLTKIYQLLFLRIWHFVILSRAWKRRKNLNCLKVYNTRCRSMKKDFWRDFDRLDKLWLKSIIPKQKHFSALDKMFSI